MMLVDDATKKMLIGPVIELKETTSMVGLLMKVF